MNEEIISVRVSDGKVEVSFEKRVAGYVDERDAAKRAAAAYKEAVSTLVGQQTQEDDGS